MPELPEVETTRRGILDGLGARRVGALVVRERRLRWPVPDALEGHLRGKLLLDIERRGKYLLFRFDDGTLLVHLGMSGSLRFAPADSAPRRHDHVDLLMADGRTLRYHDPRRFGAWLWIEGEAGRHELLRRLGPEPLGEQFDGTYLYRCSRARRTVVKQFIMDASVVVGVGNIYASEALFRAGIRPQRRVDRIAQTRWDGLADAVKSVLEEALLQGGTTLRDYVDSSGGPGYFAQRLHVYAREGEDCRLCSTPIRSIRIAQRSSFYCPRCQR